MHHALELATALVSTVTDSIQVALETSARAIEELKLEGVVEADDLAAVTARNKALEQLLSTLTHAAGHDPVPYHPATLIRWKELLAGHLVPGNPAVTVRVTTVYAL